MKKGRPARGKTRLQLGAIPVRSAADGSLEILLITTRTTKRWTIPKGWPIKGLKAHEAAAREALEEAGAVGKIHRKAVGRYLYWKRMDDHFQLCKVKLFLLTVETRLDTWLERDQRHHHWFRQEDAVDLVEEPGLKAVLRSLKR
ncbi:NUDIX domain-containing protein [Bosea sp. BK604]|uniref:NUDIX hydrolase n=1 Tax=Bosea sp. BK604 TaxID=2512180 RepID=UPI001047ADBD|nr:NUDIX domain-containing protein [Bosea sp. BK604]TCR62947.1 NUDIX domain-containing protein [Bosea sp. BK604]